MIRNALYIVLISLPVIVLGILALHYQLPIGPLVLILALIPFTGIILAGRSFKGAIPDLVFGIMDTGLLTIPALLGGTFYGVAGAIAGGVIGDSLTDAVAGFFEGSIAEWLRNRGIEESREPITTALGKMAGCLLGSGIVLTCALMFGIQPTFLNHQS